METDTVTKMKLREKFESLNKLPEMEKYFILSQVGSFINFMESAIHELDDPELIEKFDTLQTAIYEKREALAEVDV